MPKESDHGGRQVLDGVAQDVMDRFEEGLAHLARVRSGAQGLAGAVDSLMALTAGDDDETRQKNPLARFVVHAAAIRDRSGETARLLSEDTFAETLAAMVGDLGQIRERSSELRSVTYLTKIVCAQDARMNARLDSFVETLEERSAELREISTAASQAVAAIASASAEAGTTLALMSRSFADMVTETETDAADLRRLEQAHRDHILTVQTRSRRIGDEVGQAVSRLIDCLQFPDAFSQRRDHVAEIVTASAQDVGSAQSHALGRLAGAQMMAMAEALVSVTSNAGRALDAVAQSLAEQEFARGEGGEDPSARWLAAARHGNGMMLEATATGRSRLDHSLGLVSGVLGHIDTAVTGLEASADLNDSLEDSARNAAIWAARSGASGSALDVLARNVREVVTGTSALTDSLGKGLGSVRKVSDDLRAANLQDELGMLEQIQAAAKATAEEQAAMLRDLSRLQAALARHAREIREAAGLAGQAFALAAREAPRLELLSAQQEPATPAHQDDAAVDLAWVEALYSMEEERAVHRALFPASHSAAMQAAVTGTQDDEDLDDFLL